LELRALQDYTHFSRVSVNSSHG